jgi:hypothetical protein
LMPAQLFETHTPSAASASLAAHTTMSKQAIDYEKVREGLKDAARTGPAL